MKRPIVLLTGCAGFIGSHVALRLLALGYEVIGLDNLNDYYDPHLKWYRLQELLPNPSFKFIKADITQMGELSPLFEQYAFKAVINLAAQAGVRYSLVKPELYFQSNVIGMLNLLELMRKYEIEKLILASTSSLYANAVAPYSEDQPINQPISPYACSKLAAEELSYTYHYNFGLDVTIFRYFTVYGPMGRPDMSILRFIRWIATQSPIQVYGNGDQSRDFTYIQDIVNGTVSGLKPLGYEIINLGGGEVFSLSNVIAQLETMMGVEAQIEYHPAHAADMLTTEANCSKAEQLLGWKPQVPFSEGLQETVNWYLTHQDWINSISLGD